MDLLNPRYIFLLTLTILVMQACSDNMSNEPAEPVITELQPDKANPGDIVTIYGSNLSYVPEGGQIHIGSIAIGSEKAIKWNNTFIRFQLPLNAESGAIYISLGDIKSNSFYLEVMGKPGIEFIDVPAGEFMMGSEQGFGYELPVHKVKITRAFKISKFEISQKIWQVVMKSNPSPVQSDKLPVMNISWEDAIAFCNKLSQIFDLDTVYTIINGKYFFDINANGFRLPTEAEWEYACRAGSNSDYPGSGILDEIGWFNGNSAYNTHPVGTKKPNDWNIYDMNGNVWEWCWDWYDESYYSVSPSADPTGPESGTRRVLRGGACSVGATFARSSNRTYPANDFTYCGLRIIINN